MEANQPPLGLMDVVMWRGESQWVCVLVQELWREQRLEGILELYRAERARGYFKTVQEYEWLLASLAQVGSGAQLFKVCCRGRVPIMFPAIHGLYPGEQSRTRKNGLSTNYRETCKTPPPHAVLDRRAADQLA
jgi:hypothetical protein